MARKHLMTQDEYYEIREQSRYAKEFLESDNFAFIRKYLDEALSSIENTILDNTIRDVTESVTITPSIVKKFFTPKKVQVDELAGQHRFLKKFISDMQYYASLIDNLEKEIKSGRVKVDGLNEKE